MLLKKTIHKTNNLFHKTLENFKNLFFKGFQKLQKPTSLITLSCSKGKPQHTHPTDRLYIDFYDEWQSTLQKAAKRSIDKGSMIASKENVKQEDTNVAIQSPPRSKQEKAVKEKKKPGASHLRKGDVKNNSTRSNGLVEKMKELEMLDRSDMEQELDIEEAIHYYSRLRSPVYLEIVDKFFMDMHSEISVPEPSARSVNSSKRRIGSMRL
ncbi:uncharacterized protein LOC116405196 [Cucumis sativus]|uniref:OVATE domain-containing protein n=1 Tax=Cucumis sativus TaxID=3659 RepID=A0A0A0KAF5_CUCSA|nr:uncharacterized protein LOC116405196 [Cucumis sativus]KGN45372.1 hypothetical protein Csa_016780 [Cucumis sativus]